MMRQVKDGVLFALTLLVAIAAFTAAIRMSHEPLLFTAFCVMLGCAMLAASIITGMQMDEIGDKENR